VAVIQLEAFRTGNELTTALQLPLLLLFRERP
jgi:hypothetical protein